MAFWPEYHKTFRKLHSPALCLVLCKTHEIVKISLFGFFLLVRSLQRTWASPFKHEPVYSFRGDFALCPLRKGANTRGSAAFCGQHQSRTGGPRQLGFLSCLWLWACSTSFRLLLTLVLCTLWRLRSPRCIRCMNDLTGLRDRMWEARQFV